MVTLAEIKNLKVQELKVELTKRGLSVAGKKQDLLERLEEAWSESKTPQIIDTSDSKPVASVTSPVPASNNTEPQKLTNGRTAISFTATNPTASEKPVLAKPTENAQPGQKPTPIESTVLSEDEKRKQRAERFQIPASLDEKKAARAERFGLGQKAESKKTPASEGIAKLSESDKADLDEKKKERAKRFNLPINLSKEEIERQKKARLERFGSGTSNGVHSSKDDDSANMQAKLAARAERFALAGNGKQNSTVKEDPKPVIPKKPLDPAAEAKRKAREIKFTPT